MTDLRKAAEMALEALEKLRFANAPFLDEATKALRQALAQLEQEETQRCPWPDGECTTCLKAENSTPVAYLDEGLGAFYWPNDCNKYVGFTPLYAVPPHRWSNVTDAELMQEVRRRGFVIRDAQVCRKWVGLTAEEVDSIVNLCTFDDAGYDIFTDGSQVALIVETRLKEKNT